MVYSEVPNFSEPNPDYRGQQNKGVISPNALSIFMKRIIFDIYYNSVARLPSHHILSIMKIILKRIF